MVRPPRVRPNGGKFFSSADPIDKQLYTTLSAPDVNGVGPPLLDVFILSNPGLLSSHQFLFGAGGAGPSWSVQISDVRITDPTISIDFRL